MKRKIITYGGYFERFIATLSPKELIKLNYIISLLETEERMPVKFIKFVRDGLYELRMEYDSGFIQWISQEDSKSTGKGNRKSIKNKGGLLCRQMTTRSEITVLC